MAFQGFGPKNDESESKTLLDCAVALIIQK